MPTYVAKYLVTYNDTPPYEPHPDSFVSIGGYNVKSVGWSTSTDGIHRYELQGLVDVSTVPSSELFGHQSYDPVGTTFYGYATNFVISDPSQIPPQYALGGGGLPSDAFLASNWATIGSPTGYHSQADYNVSPTSFVDQGQTFATSILQAYLVQATSNKIDDLNSRFAAANGLSETLIAIKHTLNVGVAAYNALNDGFKTLDTLMNLFSSGDGNPQLAQQLIDQYYAGSLAKYGGALNSVTVSNPVLGAFLASTDVVASIYPYPTSATFGTPVQVDIDIQHGETVAADVGFSPEHAIFFLGGSDDNLVGGGKYGDVIHGGAGNDNLGGHGGNDYLNGGDGDDVMTVSGVGSNYLEGETGNDAFFLSAVGQNFSTGGGIATGGDGDDTFSIGTTNNFTTWTIAGGNGNNKLVLPHASQYYTFSTSGGFVGTPAPHLTGQDGSVLFFSEIQNLVYLDKTVSIGPLGPVTFDLGSHGASWPVSGIGDFNADGTSDILWRNPGTGQVDQWQMQGGHWSKSIDLGATKGAQWLLAGVGDFNADGTSDVLWRDVNNSQVDQWQMKNGNWSKSIDLGATKGAQWSLAGVGDFNADGTSDVLWRNISTSQVDQWQMKNGNWSKSIDLGATKGADWQLAGVGDFNGDGTTDVLWRNTSTSQVDQWQMKNGNWSKSIDLGATKGQDWNISGIGDANGDHVSDIFWFNTTTGQSEHWLMANGNWAGSIDDGTQSITLKPVGVGDLNHDSKSEVLFLDPNTSHLFDLLV